MLIIKIQLHYFCRKYVGYHFILPFFPNGHQFMLGMAQYSMHWSYSFTNNSNCSWVQLQKYSPEIRWNLCSYPCFNQSPWFARHKGYIAINNQLQNTSIQSVLGHTNLNVRIRFSSLPMSISTYHFCLHYCLETPLFCYM